MKTRFFSLLIACFFLTLSLPSFAQGLQQKVVITEGNGKSEKDAIKDALVAAVSQVRGLSISSKEMISIRDQISNETSTSTTDYKNKINSYTKGVVSQYEVLEVSQSKIPGFLSVKVKSTIPVYAAGPQINRLRLAVVPLVISQRISDKISASQYAGNWMSALEEGLVQTRRFAMLDRSFNDAINKEISQYTNGQFSNSELARLGQRAGTDYLITGELRTYSLQDQSVINPLTGQKIPRSSTLSEISLRIIDVATSQVKFAKTYGDSKTAVADIINAIYPLAIVSVSDLSVTLGAGGDDIKIGNKYRVIALGKELKDPYTNESLGREEMTIGEIEITDVQSRISQAKYLAGKNEIIERFNGGLIVRPMQQKPTSQQPQTQKPKKKSSDEW